jgi:DtxR family Mn-dependent transcriptional regulator
MKKKSTEYKQIGMKEITATMEDYLKVILDLNNTRKAVRVKDIAKRLDVKMPSVSSMLKKLAHQGLVKYRKYEYVELEDTGAYIAREISHRHGILLRFFADILTVEKEKAAEEACKIEHLLSPDTLSTLTDFMSFVESCPRAHEKWSVRFKTYREKGHRFSLCKQSVVNVPSPDNH